MLSAAAGNPLALMALPAALEAIQLAEATLLPEFFPVTAWLKRAFAAPVSELPALAGLPSRSPPARTQTMRTACLHRPPSRIEIAR